MAGIRVLERFDVFGYERESAAISCYYKLYGNFTSKKLPATGHMHPLLLEALCNETNTIQGGENAEMD